MKKQSPTNRYKKLYPLIIVLGVVAVIVAVLFTWNWYTHYTDKQKFMTLKQDMLTLQTEFNKIDPGWQYTEWCHAKGEKFKQNEVSSCGVGLKYNNGLMDTQKVKNILQNNKNFISVGEIQQYSTLQDDKMISIKFSHNTLDKNCEVSGERALASDAAVKEMNIYCHGSALDFYFPKTQ